MPDIRITLLGGFDVTIDGRPTGAGSLTRRHAAGLIKLLALTPNRRMHRERVLDALWPDESVDQALPKLHKAAHFARQAIGEPDAIVLRDDHVALFPEADVVIDATRFEELARRAIDCGDASLASDAADAYRGELLPDDGFEDWAVDAHERLAGLHTDVLALAERWTDLVAVAPTDERAHIALMREKLARGDRHAVLRQFERLERALQRELGVAPADEAVRLRDQALAAVPPAPPSPRGVIEREAELAAATAVLDGAATGEVRPIIVVGPAGIGKTALLDAIRTAAFDRGMRVATGSASRIAGAWPYAALVEAFGWLIRAQPELLDEIPAVCRDELERALTGQVAGTWSGEVGQHRLFVAAAELLRAAAEPALVLMIDDLEDADEATLRLLHHLVRTLADEPVVFALGVNAAAGPAVAELVETLETRASALRLDLTPLGEVNIRRIVQQILPDASADVVDEVIAQSHGVPAIAVELARRMTRAPGARPRELTILSGVPTATRDLLQRTAVLGMAFDTDDFVAVAGLAETDAYAHLDAALESVAIEYADSTYRFRHAIVRDALLGGIPPHRLRAIHREIADRLVAADESPARIGHHLLAAGDEEAAVPHLLRAADAEATVGAYRDALRLVERALPFAAGAERTRLLQLRADLLLATGDPDAVAAYRTALAASDSADAPRVRARLSRAALMAGDAETAAAALHGVPVTDDDIGTEVLLAQGNLAFFLSDWDRAREVAEAARVRVLAGEHNWQVLDLVALQGLLAHRRGEWFDRIRVELRNHAERPEIANSLFDGYLCAAEYLLYGPTPYSDVIDLARDLQRTAERSGALRAAAFARALIGEAALLCGDLELAERELDAAAESHAAIGSPAGEAHALQRLAEVRLARGDAASARELLERAVPLARWSVIANHLLQRIYGTMIEAAPDAESAVAVIDRAESTLGPDDRCHFCDIMLAVPAMVACAQAGDLERAESYRIIAAGSAELWEGTSWAAELEEATARIAIAAGEDGAASALERAIDGFERAGQPHDAARCRVLLDEVRRTPSSA